MDERATARGYRLAGIRWAAKTLEVIFLVISSAVAAQAMVKASGWNLWGLCAWAVSPYVIFFCLGLLMKKNMTDSVSRVITAFIMLVLAFVLYLFCLPRSSLGTACLIFVFGPPSVLVAMPVLMVVSHFIAKGLISEFR
jgi:hypothetical protein